MNIVRPSALRSLASSIVTAFVICLLTACNQSNNLTDTEHLARARELDAKGDEKAALVEVRNALQKNPKNTDARVLLAEIYVKAGGGKQAQTELEIALQRGASPSRVKLPLARAYLLQGSYDQAASQAEVTLATPPADRAAMLEVQGKARIAMRQYERGCALYDQSRAVDPNYIEAYWGSATCASVLGHFDQARSIINDAIKIKPDNSESWTLLGDIDRVDRKLDAAEKEYTKALELKSDNLNALLGRGLAYAEAKDLVNAEADIDRADKVKSGQPITSYVRGIIRFRQGRLAEAKNAFETTLTAAPEHVPSILWLGLTNFAQKNYELASTELNQYVTLVPGATKIRALLALSRARLGGVTQANVDLGELDKLNIDDPQTLAMIGEAHTFLGNATAGSEFLSKAVTLDPASINNRLELATALLQKNDVDGAITQLRSVLTQDPDSSSASALLIRALIQKKDYASAMERARALEKLDPKSPVAGDFIGSIQLLQGDQSGAQATFDRLLDANPTFFPAANNLALMAIKRGDLNAARTYYQRALKADPQSLSALMGLHSVERAQDHPAEADKILVEAVRLHPTEVLPAQLLAQTDVASGQPRKAIDATAGAIAAHPGDSGLLEVRGLAYLAAGEPASALIEFNRLVQTRNNLADGYLYLAATYKTLGDKAAVKAALASAVKTDPNNARVQVAVANDQIAAGKFDDALAGARRLQKSNPENPNGFLLEATVLSASKKSQEAVTVLKAAVQRLPKSAALRIALARAQSSINDTKGLIANLAEWHAAEPQNPVAAEALGEAYFRTGDEAGALVAYQAELALLPTNARALNNVAFLLRQKSPKEAVQLAQRATLVNPSNADPFDTLGQIQLEQGDVDDALASFRKANSLAPEDPVIRLHIVKALIKSGQPQLARRELERLLASSRGFEGEADARALLAQIPKS